MSTDLACFPLYCYYNYCIANLQTNILLSPRYSLTFVSKKCFLCAFTVHFEICSFLFPFYLFYLFLFPFYLFYLVLFQFFSFLLLVIFFSFRTLHFLSDTDTTLFFNSQFLPFNDIYFISQYSIFHLTTSLSFIINPSIFPPHH